MNLAVIICYDRVHNLKHWFDAWQKMDIKGWQLRFAITGDVVIRFGELELAKRYENLGMDIGVVKRIIDTEQFDRLFWCPDDFLPLRPNLMQLYDTADLVGTFWSTEVSHHIRSGGVCITKEVAKSLKFPPKLLTEKNINRNKYNCHRFEHLDYNFYEQVRSSGFTVKMIDGTTPSNSPMWRDVPQNYLQAAGGSEELNYVCPF